MDFASLMSAEISKKRPTSTSPAAESITAPPSKYIKRGDAESSRQAKYLAEQRALEAEKAARFAAKLQKEEEEAEASRKREEKRKKLAEESKLKREAAEAEEEQARRKKLGLPELVKPEEGTEVAAPDDVPDEELFERLRAKGHPIRLFGETHAGRLKRLKGLDIVLTDGPIPTTLALVEEKDMKVAQVPKEEDVEGRNYLFRQLASYFTMVLKEWEAALRNEARDTFASKAAWNAMLQSKENMTPLFRKFETGDLAPDLLASVVEIVCAAQERRYVDANDGYLRLSIGKAAWPIGVTMVGIHERSAREKLHDSDKGHVMGDEITRKFLQSIKRCLSFAQVRWPPGDMRQLMG